MVKVTLVDEEVIEVPSTEEKIIEENDADFTDTDSEVSDDEYDDDDIENETIMERIVALKDVIAPQYRNSIASTASSIYNGISSSFLFGGKALWVITTSSLLLGVPLSLSIISEQQLIEMEKEMKLSQSTNEVLAPGAEQGFQAPPAQQ
ncbi:Tom22p [Sugiyamaella lignohabitans]|uniref:Tom22p n=1 Tax=Sugiyamaella lignohabitans TaxID=796027 RepID=A0A167E3R5_9ASCO|nr:Tom22p [Sugiyamaella lignohabitans]ANB13604.1 Tom22p [Sugiyamaella lignohabitans]